MVGAICRIRAANALKPPNSQFPQGLMIAGGLRHVSDWPILGRIWPFKWETQKGHRNLVHVGVCVRQNLVHPWVLLGQRQYQMAIGLNGQGW